MNHIPNNKPNVEKIKTYAECRMQNVTHNISSIAVSPVLFSTGGSYFYRDGYGASLGDIITTGYKESFPDDGVKGHLIANDDSYGVQLGTPLGIVDHDTDRTSGDTSIQQNKSKDTIDRSQTINTSADSYGEPVAPVYNTSAGKGRLHHEHLFTKKDNGRLQPVVGKTYNDKKPSLTNDDNYGIPLATPLDLSNCDIIDNTTRNTTIQYRTQQTKTMSSKLSSDQPIRPNILDLSSTKKIPSPTTNDATTQNVSGAEYQPSESVLPNRKQVSTTRHLLNLNKRQ
jgi:hypothetical protein